MAEANYSVDAGLRAELGSELFVRGQEFVIQGSSIGSGKFSVVHSAIHSTQETKHDVALKEATRSNTDLANRFLKEEIIFLRDHKHTNIIGLLGWFCKNDCITAVLELAKWVLVPGWTTKEWNGGKPVIANAVRVLYGIADGMKFLHSQSKPVLHLDLKSANILVMEDETVKVADFGSYEKSKYSDGGTKVLTTDSDEIYTTLEYIPPERLRNKKTDPSRRYDVYSYGIVMWEVLSYRQKKRIYGEADDRTIKTVVMDGTRPDRRLLHHDTPEYLRLLMKQCWAPEVNERPYFENIVERIKSMQDRLACSGNDMAAAELSTTVPESQHVDVVDSRVSTSQVQLQRSVGAVVEREVISAKADLGNGRRYAQEMGAVIASHANKSRSPVLPKSADDQSLPKVPALKKKFKKARTMLIQELDGTSVDRIIDDLFANSLIYEEEAETCFKIMILKVEKARFLCDIVDSKKVEVAESVFEHLKSTCGRGDLADFVMKQSVELKE